METILEATARDSYGKNEARRTRRDGKVPGVLYGEGKDATAISVEPRALLKILHSESGANTLIQLKLAGHSGDTRQIALYFADGEQMHDFRTMQDHAAPKTTSDLLFKGALRGKARMVYQGLIKVHKDAQRSDAYQANRNLILSNKARADSIPSLEIEANDVRCTHGATVGQVDEDQLFYLMARGLPRRDAEQLIIRGFFEPVLERIPAESLRALVTEAIERKAAA